MPDVIEKLSHSIVQHGSYNRRIYLMKLHERDMPSIVPVLEHLASEKGYEKILVKTPAHTEMGLQKKDTIRRRLSPVILNIARMRFSWLNISLRSGDGTKIASA